MDAVQTRWNAWVLGYSPTRQRQQLRDLGLDDSGYGSMIIALTVSIATLLAALAIWVLYPRGARDPLRVAYEVFCRRMARKGLSRAAYEGPWDSAERITAQRPELRPAITRITQLYVDLRCTSTPTLIDLLKREVATFRP
jgi:hypothetical protein